MSIISQMLSNQVSFSPSCVIAPAGVMHSEAASVSAANLFATFFIEISILENQMRFTRISKQKIPARRNFHQQHELCPCF